MKYNLFNIRKQTNCALNELSKEIRQFNIIIAKLQIFVWFNSIFLKKKNFYPHLIHKLLDLIFSYCDILSHGI